MEPWNGWANSVNEEGRHIELAPGETKEFKWSVTIESVSYTHLDVYKRQQRISLKYLEQIVTPLAKAGLVSSVRGAQGGYRLARPDTEITAGEILRAVEGELTAIPCLASSVECPRRGQCHTLDFWSGLNDLINKYVDGVTLHQLRNLPEE